MALWVLDAFGLAANRKVILLLWTSRHSRKLAEPAAGGQVRCREHRDFAGHSEFAMSTSRNSTPLYEAIRSLVLSARQSVSRLAAPC